MQWINFDGAAIPVHDCIIFFYLSDSSVVKFSATAFENPYLYFTEKETLFTIDDYTQYFTDMHAANPGFVVRVCLLPFLTVLWCLT